MTEQKRCRPDAFTPDSGPNNQTRIRIIGNVSSSRQKFARPQKLTSNASSPVSFQQLRPGQLALQFLKSPSGQMCTVFCPVPTVYQEEAALLLFRPNRVKAFSLARGYRRHLIEGGHSKNQPSWACPTVLQLFCQQSSKKPFLVSDQCFCRVKHVAYPLKSTSRNCLRFLAKTPPCGGFLRKPRWSLKAVAGHARWKGRCRCYVASTGGASFQQ